MGDFPLLPEGIGGVAAIADGVVFLRGFCFLLFVVFYSYFLCKPILVRDIPSLTRHGLFESVQWSLGRDRPYTYFTFRQFQ